MKVNNAYELVGKVHILLPPEFENLLKPFFEAIFPKEEDIIKAWDAYEQAGLLELKKTFNLQT